MMSDNQDGLLGWLPKKDSEPFFGLSREPAKLEFLRPNIEKLSKFKILWMNFKKFLRANWREMLE